MLSQDQPPIGFGWATQVMRFIMLITSTLPIIIIKKLVPSPAPLAPRRITRLQRFQSYPVYAFQLWNLLWFYGNFNVFFFITLYVLEVYRTDVNLALYILPIKNGSSTFGRLVPNFIADNGGLLITVIDLHIPLRR
jgi:predicted MFS family arabinose efflux permease